MTHTIYAALAIPYRKSRNGNEFLLLQHDNGTWTFPGGGKEAVDKSLKDCLIREIREETGLQIDVSQINETGLVNRFTYDNKKPERAGMTGETHFFLLELSGDERIIPLDKIQKAAWMSSEEIAQHIPYEAERTIFEKAERLI